MDLNEIYRKEKIINSYFRGKYNYDNEEIFNKQVLELLCELSEFAMKLSVLNTGKMKNRVVRILLFLNLLIV